MITNKLQFVGDENRVVSSVFQNSVVFVSLFGGSGVSFRLM